MKKHLLKALLICLGATLLCGLSSFKTSEGVKSPRSNVSIIYDTIITHDGEVSRVIKEVVDENGQTQCTCSLFVSVTGGNWRLGISSSCNCPLEATIVYTKYYIQGDEFKEVTIGPIPEDVGRVEKPALESGTIGESFCIPVSVDAHLKDQNQ